MRTKPQKLMLLCNTLVLSLFLFAALSAKATEELLQFKDGQQQALYRELTAELRCPKCQNQNIADSNAVVAVDMREKTYQLVQQGQNKDEVIAFMKQRYGDFVHYQPPVQWSTIWLWLAPLLLLAGLFYLMLQKQRKAGVEVGMTEQNQELDASLQAMIDEAVQPKSPKEPR